MKPFRAYDEEEFLVYLGQVEEILESFDYPDLVRCYREEDIAKSLAGTVTAFYFGGESPMMCAVCVWALTMTMQIMPEAERMTKH